MSALKWVFLRLACTCEGTCQSVWRATQRKSLRKYNLPLLATTCVLGANLILIGFCDVFLRLLLKCFGLRILVRLSVAVMRRQSQ